MQTNKVGGEETKQTNKTKRSEEDKGGRREKGKEEGRRREEGFPSAARLGDGSYQCNFLPIDNFKAEYHDSVVCAECQSRFDWVTTCLGKVCCKYDSIKASYPPSRGEVRFAPSCHFNTCVCVSVLGVPLGG